jgi:hypothetical protein
VRGGWKGSLRRIGVALPKLVDLLGPMKDKANRIGRRKGQKEWM